MKLILRSEIPEDLREVVNYLDAHSQNSGNDFIAAVFSAMEQVQKFPGIGSLKSYRGYSGGDLRSWLVPGFASYVIYYLNPIGAVVVVAVVHGARDIPTILRARLASHFTE